MKNSSLPHLFWLGDSISLHYFPYLLKYLGGIAHVEVRQGYQEAILDINHARGANCGDSSLVLAFLGKLLAMPDFRPEWVFFNCGLHDIKTDPQTGARQVELEEYTSNISAIIELIVAHGRRPVWITTTPVHDDTHQKHCPEVHRHQSDVLVYNQRAEQVMLAKGVPMIDLHGFTAKLEGELYMDHVHYSENIRQLQAAYLTGQAERILKG